MLFRAFIVLCFVFGNIFAQETSTNDSLFGDFQILELDYLLENIDRLEEATNQNFSTTNILTLNDAIAMAIQNNNSIQESLRDLQAAQASYTGSIQDFYVPELGVGASMSLRNDFSETTPQGSGFRLNFVAPSITISKTLFNGFNTFYSHKIAKENYLNAQNTYSNLIRQTVFDTTTRYYTQFLQEEEYIVSLERLKQLRDQVTQAEANFRAGRVSDYDVSLAQGQYYSGQPNFYSAERTRYFNRIDFYNFIRYVPKEGELVLLEGNLLDVTNVQFSDFENELAVEYILSNDTQLANLRTAYSNAISQKGQQNSARMPKLDVNFDFSPNYGQNFRVADFTQDDYHGSYGVSLSLRIPILEWIPGTGVASRVKAAQKNIEKSEIVLLDAEEDRLLNLKNTLLQIREFSQSLTALRLAEQNARRASEIAVEQYRFGRISLLELNDAQLSYINAKRDLLQAVYNDLQAKLSIQEASNDLDGFLEEIEKINAQVQSNQEQVQE